MEPPRKTARLTGLPAPEEVINEKDLPLLANVKEVKVVHYLMKLKPDFDRRVVVGSVILFLDWVDKHHGQNDKVVLDQCFLRVKRVLGLKSADVQVDKLLREYFVERKGFWKVKDWWEQSGEGLEWNQSKWELTISGWGGHPPEVLRIDYETLETSPSIHWRPCQGWKWGEAGENKCCYTPAPMMNNRGLFPCQEPPEAMATWEVVVECQKDYVPLLTGDEPGEVIDDGGDLKKYYFYCSMPLPMSTFAMVVGKLQLGMELKVPEELKQEVEMKVIPEETGCAGHSKYPCRFGNVEQRQQKVIPVRLFSLDPDTIPVDLSKFTKLVYSSLLQSWTNFGPHPFSRLDIVIVPKSYPHEALASPSMIFLAPNNFYGDEPQYVSRLPHEICHSWFGLLIGSLDWSEEWLSEGFATFCEDLLGSLAFQTYYPNRNKEQIERDQNLKILMRFTSLQNELKNTSNSNELHVMSKANQEDGLTKTSVTNGLEPIKQFMYVHYYKGYLLLWHLTGLVGRTEFLKFLKTYVWRYHGQLVTSEMFLEAYHSHFSDILCFQDCDEIMQSLKKEWLQSSSIPEPYNSLDFHCGEDFSETKVPPVFIQALEPLKAIKTFYSDLLTNPQESSSEVHSKLETLSASQIMLFLELILTGVENQKDNKLVEILYFQHLVTSPVFQEVEIRFNADVVHRWCELIVYFRDKARLPVVERFLRNNIAMGVYLYGELMITERFVFQKKAKQLYYELEGVYDLATKKILKEMLF